MSGNTAPSRLALQQTEADVLVDAGQRWESSRRSVMAALLVSTVSKLALDASPVCAGASQRDDDDGRTAAKLALPYRVLPPTPVLPAPDRDGIFQTRGMNLYYAQFGKGPPLLMLHGGMANSCYWGHQVKTLCQSHCVTVMDTRGHGRSALTIQNFSYRYFAQDVLELLNYLRIPATSIVGWSDGAITGLQLALSAPARISRLFAFGANSNAEGLLPEGARSRNFKDFGERCKSEYAVMSPDPARWPNLTGGLRQMWRTEPNFTAQDLAHITIPVTISQGEHDEIIRPLHGASIADAIPGARLIMQKGVSHFAMLQQPSEFTRRVEEFLAAS